MHKMTIYVSDLSNAAMYYEAAFGFSKTTEIDAEEHLTLCATSGDKIQIELSLVLNKELELLQSHDKDKAFTWLSDDFWGDYHRLSAIGVIFESSPNEINGQMAVFLTDGHGFHWVLKSL